MTWYLTITPAAGQSLVAETRPLVEFLAALAELRQTGPVTFEAAPHLPWVCVILAKTGPTGGYACAASFLPAIDVVELICSDLVDTSWYDRLAGRIALFLGWVAVEEWAFGMDQHRQVWPPPEQRHVDPVVTADPAS